MIYKPESAPFWHKEPEKFEAESVRRFGLGLPAEQVLSDERFAAFLDRAKARALAAERTSDEELAKMFDLKVYRKRRKRNRCANKAVANWACAT